MMIPVRVLICLLPLGLGAPPEPKEDARPPGVLRELVPGVLVGKGVVEFGGTVCADLSHPQTPVVYLELLVTGPDSREHESLVLTRVRASAIHAGLLAAGFESGHPVRFEGDRVAALPTGDRVSVAVGIQAEPDSGDDTAFVELASWAVRRDTGVRLDAAPGWWLVFAGSVLDGQAGAYAADKTGTVIGLTGFGTEVIAAAWDLSPQADVDEPVWIVDKDRVPAFGTPVRIRITRAGSPAEPGDTGDAKTDNEPRGTGAADEKAS